MPFQLSNLFGKKVLLITHSGCDIDSLSSTAAIYFSLAKKSRITIGIPDHMNLTAAQLAKSLSIPFTINPKLDSFDAVVCLDFNELGMLGSLKEQFQKFKGEKYLIDHHRKGKETLAPAKNSISNPKAISTTEIIYDLLKKTNLKIPKKAYLCIATGIISDSASFMVADHSTFLIMGEVMKKANTPYSSILSLFSVEKDFSEKVACLKAAKRCRIFRSAESIIVTADIGAFESSAASVLVRVGADVALCGYSDKGQVRISGRVNNFWMRKNGFDLARDVFLRLESFFEGKGGGHPGAAGFNGVGGFGEGHLQKCAELTHEFIMKKSGLASQMKEYD